jgi:serine/threonine protein kinase
MGEVYRATDTKLGREVALKILPEHFAQDADRMARFEREAKVLASLNHPNIAQIYGVEEHALVMELVEGESPKGPMPFDEAWKIAMQIADALEYAHERGVVHRDLKPANIRVTPEGVVKLLDFGLAKAFSDAPDSARSDPSNSPTITLGGTVAGVVLGTAAYMAPEQAKGKQVDKRADIWSWGVVLYELLTGDRLFKGEDTADTLAKVLTKEPDLGRVAPQVRKLLRRCLEKVPKKLPRDIGEAQYLLEEASQGKAPAMWNPWAVPAVAFALAAVILAFIHFRQAPPQKTVQRYSIILSGNATNLQTFAISPDGRLLAIAATTNGKRQLWLRPLDTLQALPIPGTEDAAFPFWSPDSRYIGFFAQEKLKKIAATGGPPQSLCDAPDGNGGSWNRNDVILFSHSNSGMAIQSVSAGGGIPADVTRRTGLPRWPLFLPDGRHFLYLVSGAASREQNGVYLSSLDGKENRRVLSEVSSVVYGGGRLLFVRDDTLLAQRFDATSGQTVGEVLPVAESVSIRLGYYHPVTVSETGVLLYESGGVVGNSQMVWYDRRGKLLGAIGAPGPIGEPAISPDEKSVAFRRSRNLEVGADLWLLDLARGAEQRFTTEPSYNGGPFWSPKGDRIVYGSIRGGGIGNLNQKVASGAGQDELLLASGNTKLPTQWSWDGRFIVYPEYNPKTKWDIWVLPMKGAERKSVPFLHSAFNEFLGQLSPDSHWMAYTSDKTGQREVYVVAFPTGEGETRISIAGGEQPRWRGDGKELFL